MKKYKLTITTVLALPDDFELADDPEGFPCLARSSSYYIPTIEWLERHHYLNISIASALEGPPSVGWESVDDDTANEFIQAESELEDYQIEPVQRPDASNRLA
jgi:hypothetical protein